MYVAVVMVGERSDVLLVEERGDHHDLVLVEWR